MNLYEVSMIDLNKMWDIPPNLKDWKIGMKFEILEWGGSWMPEYHRTDYKLEIVQDERDRSNGGHRSIREVHHRARLEGNKFYCGNKDYWMILGERIA